MFQLTAPRYAPGDIVEVAGCRVRLRVDGRARRVSLRVDAANREVVATAPSPRRLKDAARFAAERAAWIAGALGRLPDAQALVPGGTLEVLGRPWRLERAASRRAQGMVDDELGARILAHGDDFLFGRAVVRILKAEALRLFTERTAVHAAALGHPAPKTSVMDARGRWGSCTPARAGRPAGVRYSWRLVLAPWEVADYVAAHECAHLVHADHSPRFWAVVDSLVPDVKGARPLAARPRLAPARGRTVTDPADRPMRTFGRIRGRPLRPGRAVLMDEMLPRLRLDLSGPLDPHKIMPAATALWVELGFGAGEHLAAQAAAHPDVLLLGAEPFLNGAASALRHIHEAGLGNVRVHPGDGREVLAALPAGSVGRLYILFPDPWPKTRHHKRRLVNDETIAEFARVLAPGGLVRFATDWADYAAWTLERFIRSPDFRWTAERADDWRLPPADHVPTRYEQKRLGDCAPIFLEFARR